MESHFSLTGSNYTRAKWISRRPFSSLLGGRIPTFIFSPSSKLSSLLREKFCGEEIPFSRNPQTALREETRSKKLVSSGKNEAVRQASEIPEQKKRWSGGPEAVSFRRKDWIDLRGKKEFYTTGEEENHHCLQRWMVGLFSFIVSNPGNNYILLRYFVWTHASSKWNKKCSTAQSMQRFWSAMFILVACPF